jgi:hypothetical protein
MRTYTDPVLIDVTEKEVNKIYKLSKNVGKV